MFVLLQNNNEHVMHVNDVCSSWYRTDTDDNAKQYFYKQV